MPQFRESGVSVCTRAIHYGRKQNDTVPGIPAKTVSYVSVSIPQPHYCNLQMPATAFSSKPSIAHHSFKFVSPFPPECHHPTHQYGARTDYTGQVHPRYVSAQKC